MKSKREKMKSDFSKVSEYILTKYGFNTILCPDTTSGGVCDFLNRQIVVNSSIGIEKRLYILLHETGHILIRWNWKKFEKEFSAHAGHYADGRISRSKKFKVSTIEEEFEAWKRGKRVAKKLSIEIDDIKFDKFKSECLMSYINWATYS
tara:strand:+ start:146 stop:592 length:447 start_codon:yes stop_codon:yes gene_type:complete